MFVACVSTSLLFTVKYYSIVWIYFLIIHSSVDRHLGFFHILDIMNNVAMNIHIKFLCGYVLISLGFVPKSRILGHMVTPYKIIFGNFKDITKQLHNFTFPPIMREKVLISPHPSQCLLFSIFFIIATLSSLSLWFFHFPND